MNTLASSLVAGSAGIVLTLGLIHLVYTFWGRKLHPRDETLTVRMKEVSPVISRDTTMWKTWIGFNASHSCSAILFGLLYGYFALCQSELLFHSPFLLTIGALFLAGYIVLAKVYWFSIPLGGIVLSAALYFGALIVG